MARLRIAVVNNGSPFVRGGAEHLADALTDKLGEFGHEACLIRFPFQRNPLEGVVEHMVACRLTRLEEFDLVIALKFPAYYVQHQNKVVWLLHQFRQVYDLWDDTFRNAVSPADALEVRRIVKQADNTYLPEAKHIYVNSSVTAERLARFNGIESEVLFPPLHEPDSYYSKEYGDYIFCPSRMNATKRQDLLVRAIGHCSTGVKLVLAGIPEGETQERALRELIERSGVSERVEIIPRFISEEEKRKLYAGALATAYVPFDEDSYGYVALESYLSKRPVVTATDSGGIHILVKDQHTGRIVAPDPVAMATVFDELYLDRKLAEQFGEAGHELVQSLEITWQSVIQRLTSHA